MAKEKNPMTPGLRFLKDAGAAFEIHSYKYVDKGGTGEASRALGVDEFMVVKTLVFEDENKRPLLALMHGDRQVSTKNLARELGVKAITPCSPDAAGKHTGYLVGGISPFGTKKELPVYVEQTIFDLEKIYINAGKRGLLVEISPLELKRLLKAAPVNSAL
ncbi:MAG: aminoacyl-tRNA deacylase [Pseudomonadota bacterium]